MRKPPLLLVAILIVAAAVRTYGLDTRLAWHDEVYTRMFAAGRSSSLVADELYAGRALPVREIRALQRQDPESAVLDTVTSLARNEPQHPPLYYVLVRAWVRLFGDGIAALRSLSVVAGVLAVPATYALGRELYRDARAATWGAALVAVSPFFVLYSQEAREYASWAALLLLSTALLLRAIRITEEDAPGRERLAGAWVAYTIAVAASFYTSFSTASAIFAHVLFIVFRERGRATRTSLGAAAALTGSAILFAPWAWMLWTHLESFRASMAWASDIVIPESQLLWTLALNLTRPVLDVWTETDTLAARLAIGLAVAGIAAASVASLRRGPRDARLLVPLLVVVPIALLLGPDLSAGGIRSVSARYLTASLIGVILALAPAVAAAAGGKAWARPALLVPLAALASTAGNLVDDAPWTKGVSGHLPAVAAEVNRSSAPLLIGNREQHHPGNLFALSNLLDDDARLALLPIGQEDRFPLPHQGSTVFLYSPTEPYRRALESREHVVTRLLLRDLYLSLWIVEPRS